MFQVKPVKGKGFGIVATKFIKKGVLILQEDPQIQIEPNHFRNPESPPENYVLDFDTEPKIFTATKLKSAFEVFDDYAESGLGFPAIALKHIDGTGALKAYCNLMEHAYNSRKVPRNFQGKKISFIPTPGEKDNAEDDLMSSMVANPEPWKIWIRELCSLFNQMTKSDQKQYLKLPNKFEETYTMLGKAMLFILVTEDSEDPEKILRIVFIFFSNYWKGGKVMIKISRFNHSCRPNAAIKLDSNQIWTLSDIKPGQEISIDYCAGEGFLGLRSKESRKIYIRQNVLGEQILCSCDFCKEEQEGIFYPGIRYQTLLQSKMDELIAEIEKLEEELENAKQPHSEQDNKGVFEMFPPGKCRILVLRYKQLYKLSTEKKAQPFYLYHIVKDGYTAAYWFYEVCYTLDLQHKEIAGEFKNICIMFAKAAAGFGKHLGNKYVDVNKWEKRQNFDKYFMDDITDYVGHATRFKSGGQITALSDLKP